ncbi:DUF4352 domain-containing protein [Streptomyces hirsutus]|uniref:DUF4352 domain-containing protein n=1 Tax=Streptomyces hirsutus TaxID=35620 RepID=UPI00362D0A7E
MSQQYPQQPNQPYPPQQPQPGYGYPPQPGYGAPAPQPPKKRGFAKIAGLGCAGILALFVIIGIAANGGESGDGKSTDESVTAEEPARDDKDAGTDKESTDDKPAKEKEAAAPQGPVKISAKKTSFSKSILADDGNYTSVHITITNDGDESIHVNPLYFSITDTDGTKRTAELGIDEKQIDTVDLAPGENISGTVTGKGAFTPKYVTYTDGFLGDPVRADVS